MYTNFTLTETEIEQSCTVAKIVAKNFTKDGVAFDITYQVFICNGLRIPSERFIHNITVHKAALYIEANKRIAAGDLRDFDTIIKEIPQREKMSLTNALWQDIVNANTTSSHVIKWAIKYLSQIIK